MESRTKIDLLLLEHLFWKKKKKKKKKKKEKNTQRNIACTEGVHFNTEMARQVFNRKRSA